MRLLVLPLRLGLLREVTRRPSCRVQEINISVKKRKIRNAKAFLAAVLPWSVPLQRQRQIEVTSCSCLVLS